MTNTTTGNQTLDMIRAMQVQLAQLAMGTQQATKADDHKATPANTNTPKEQPNTGNVGYGEWHFSQHSDTQNRERVLHIAERLGELNLTSGEAKVRGAIVNEVKDFCIHGIHTCKSKEELDAYFKPVEDFFKQKGWKSKKVQPFPQYASNSRVYCEKVGYKQEERTSIENVSQLNKRLQALRGAEVDGMDAFISDLRKTKQEIITAVCVEAGIDTEATSVKAKAERSKAAKPKVDEFITLMRKALAEVTAKVLPEQPAESVTPPTTDAAALAAQLAELQAKIAATETKPRRKRNASK